MSIKVILELKAKPEKLQELEDVLAVFIPETKAFDGCSDIKLVQNQDDLLHLTTIENWDSRAYNEKYLAWRTETGGLETLSQLVSEPPKLTYFDELKA